MFLVFRNEDSDGPQRTFQNPGVAGLEAGTWHFQSHDLGSILDQVMWFGHEDVAQWPEGLLSMLEALGLIPHTA